MKNDVEVKYCAIGEGDYDAFHELLNEYYRDGEDADTAQEEIDAFIRLLFDKVLSHEIEGCLVKAEEQFIGFVLWGIDTEDFDFSEMPGYGTIMEVGFTGKARSSGHGKELVSYVEDHLREKGIRQCYVSAYGPAQEFWTRCGYADSGRTAENGLPIMIKEL